MRKPCSSNAQTDLYAHPDEDAPTRTTPAPRLNAVHLRKCRSKDCAPFVYPLRFTATWMPSAEMRCAIAAVGQADTSKKCSASCKQTPGSTTAAHEVCLTRKCV